MGEVSPIPPRLRGKGMKYPGLNLRREHGPEPADVVRERRAAVAAARNTAVVRNAEEPAAAATHPIGR